MSRCAIESAPAVVTSSAAGVEAPADTAVGSLAADGAAVRSRPDTAAPPRPPLSLVYTQGVPAYTRDTLPILRPVFPQSVLVAQTDPLAIDYSFARPTPKAIRAAGYIGVLRYLSTTASKNLSAIERDALFAAGLGILLAWETTTARATQGSTAGVEDAKTALAQANALGYPSALPIFFAVDETTTWESVAPYFVGASAVLGSRVRAYGSVHIMQGAAGAGLDQGWQSEAWSGTTVTNTHACLYQRVTPTRQIAGAAGEYDEDVILDSSLVWFTSVVPPAPLPVPTTGIPVTQVEIEVSIGATGCGWAKPTTFTVNDVVSVVPINQSPNVINRYEKVAYFDGITAQGEMVFVGGVAGSFSYRVWLKT